MFVLLFIFVQVQSFMLTRGLPVLIHRSVLGTASLYIETVRSEIKLIIWEVTPFSPTAAQYVHATDVPNKPKHLLYCQLLSALESCISTICSSFFFNLLDGGNEDLSTRCKPICPGRVAGVAQSRRADGWFCLWPYGFHMWDHLLCRRHCH